MQGRVAVVVGQLAEIQDEQKLLREKVDSLSSVSTRLIDTLAEQEGKVRMELREMVKLAVTTGINRVGRNVSSFKCSRSL